MVLRIKSSHCNLHIKIIFINLKIKIEERRLETIFLAISKHSLETERNNFAIFGTLLRDKFVTDGSSNSTLFFLKLLYTKHGTRWSVKLNFVSISM